MTGLYKLVYGTGIYFVGIPPFLPNAIIVQTKSRETNELGRLLHGSLAPV